MNNAYVFPGQASQFVGMGKELYEADNRAKEIFEKGNEILGFEITEVMFNGTEEDLKQTSVTQPAVFLYSVVKWMLSNEKKDIFCVAGHSLGEYSALVACNALAYEDALQLVQRRAEEMQKACDMNPGTMAAVLGLDNETIKNITTEIDEIVVAANYNCPGQLVISGSEKGIDLACAKMKEAGAKRCLPLKVGGAFHSPLMNSAREALAQKIEETVFNEAEYPIYQNVTGKGVRDKDEIQKNLIRQLSEPVKWTQTMENMINDGAEQIVEIGGRVLQGFVKRLDRKFPTKSI